MSDKKTITQPSNRPKAKTPKQIETRGSYIPTSGIVLPPKPKKQRER